MLLFILKFYSNDLTLEFSRPSQLTCVSTQTVQMWFCHTLWALSSHPPTHFSPGALTTMHVQSFYTAPILLSLQPHPSLPSWSTGSSVMIPRGTLCQAWLIVSHSPWCHSRDIPGYPLLTQIFPRVSIFSSNPDGPGALSTPL